MKQNKFNITQVLKEASVNAIDFYQKNLSKYTVSCPHKEGKNCSNLVKDNFADPNKNLIESIKSSIAILMMCGLSYDDKKTLIDRQKIIDDEYKKYNRFRYTLLASIFKNRFKMALSKAINKHTDRYVLNGAFGSAFLGGFTGAVCADTCCGNNDDSDGISCAHVGCGLCAIAGCLLLFSNK